MNICFEWRQKEEEEENCVLHFLEKQWRKHAHTAAGPSSKKFQGKKMLFVLLPHSPRALN